MQSWCTPRACLDTAHLIMGNTRTRSQSHCPEVPRMRCGVTQIGKRLKHTSLRRMACPLTGSHLEICASHGESPLGTVVFLVCKLISSFRLQLMSRLSSFQDTLCRRWGRFELYIQQITRWKFLTTNKKIKMKRLTLLDITLKSIYYLVGKYW